MLAVSISMFPELCFSSSPLALLALNCTIVIGNLLPPVVLHHQDLDHADEDVEEVELEARR
jgi:hypothetical protein